VRRRADGDTYVIEDEDGAPWLTVETRGSTVLMRQGGWLLVKDKAADSQALLSGLAPGGVPGMTLRFFDLTIELHSDMPDVLHDVRGMYSGFACGAVPSPDVVIHALRAASDFEHPYVIILQPDYDRGLYMGKGFAEVSYLNTSDDLLFHVHGEIEILFLMNNARYAFIHGAAVEKDGVGYMMPADSGSGKTTLAMALLSAGYRFLSDEFAVLGPDGMLAPFPRSMSVRMGTLKMFPDLCRRQDEFAAANPGAEESYSIDAVREFGGAAGAACPVRCVLFPRYDPGSEPALREISRMTAVGRLVGSRNYVSLGTADKSSALNRLLDVLSNAQCFDLVTGDLPKTIALIDVIHNRPSLLQPASTAL
jgi:hypothetical protein